MKDLKYNSEDIQKLISVKNGLLKTFVFHFYELYFLNRCINLKEKRVRNSVVLLTQFCNFSQMSLFL